MQGEGNWDSGQFLNPKKLPTVPISPISPLRQQRSDIPLRHLAYRNLRQFFMRGDVDHRDGIRSRIGDVGALAIGGERYPVGVMTDLRVAAQLQSGIVWVNCWMLRDLRTPFGGVKESGVGREGGMDALRFFTEAKNVCVKL